MQVRQHDVTTVLMSGSETHIWKLSGRNLVLKLGCVRKARNIPRRRENSPCCVRRGTFHTANFKDRRYCAKLSSWDFVWVIWVIWLFRTLHLWQDVIRMKLLKKEQLRKITIIFKSPICTVPPPPPWPNFWQLWIFFCRLRKFTHFFNQKLPLLQALLRKNCAKST